jgi:hypothetical protein
MRSSCNHVLKQGLAPCAALAEVLAVGTPAQAQYVQIQSIEVTPFVGLRLGGTFSVQREGSPPAAASLDDASSYGVSAGVRFDDLSMVEFRWTRSKSELQLGGPAVEPHGTSVKDVSLNQFHADFTREFEVPEIKGLRSYLMLSVGATHVSVPSDGFTRFSFGFAGGLKQSLGSRLAIRGEVHWLPIWIDPGVGGWACTSFGGSGCLVVLSGELTEQWEMSIGPVFRF